MNKIFSTIKNPELTSLIVRTYAFKSDLKIKWVRPEKICCTKPEKSGDLAPMPPIDKKQFLLEFRNSKELETADEHVKKLFSLEFNPSKYTKKLYVHDSVEKLKRHEFDSGSIEVRLARWTGYIRAWQEVLQRFPKNKKLKVCLKELIDKRKKHLKYLRRWDYKKFEWILDQLNIIYKPPPNEFRWVTRKESLVKLTNKYCDGIKEKRLAELKLAFENEQPAFLQEKIRSLEFIRDEQKECGAEITVTQEEIDEAKKQLEELKAKKVVVEEA
ncbi:28S ribosomal protein S15, mitochondrial [Anthonomus grandis grandis]|uniref:28S ribosomal protein S15, mitochondrial n=1 Tax=Anthonomus grandis grandis TaxID=2921223 RepID=UPI002165F887|nr:28S ribosomal protein S15, mitochondrial [Anthonomus grandis grandis]